MKLTSWLRALPVHPVILRSSAKTRNVSVDVHPVPPTWEQRIVLLPSVIAVKQYSKKPIALLSTDYKPLNAWHPVFGGHQYEEVPRTGVRNGRRLSTSHPAFGTAKREITNVEFFVAPILVTGFFLSVDPNFACWTKDRMNPNTQLTIHDAKGSKSRIRYRCDIEMDSGFKVEALIRFQVGWISPVATFTHVPHVIFLGKGLDVSVPFLFHFTIASILDENGIATGSFLYLSGTPLMGFSAGFCRVRRGKLVLDPPREVKLTEGTETFLGHFHYRQLGFLVFKILVYVVSIIICIPATHNFILYILPDPLHRHSESPPE